MLQQQLKKIKKIKIRAFKIRMTAESGTDSSCESVDTLDDSYHFSERVEQLGGGKFESPPPAIVVEHTTLSVVPASSLGGGGRAFVNKPLPSKREKSQRPRRSTSQFCRCGEPSTIQ